MLDVLLEWKRLIYRLVLAAAVLSVAVSLVLPKWYTANSTILPPGRPFSLPAASP